MFVINNMLLSQPIPIFILIAFICCIIVLFCTIAKICRHCCCPNYIRSYAAEQSKPSEITMLYKKIENV